MAKGARSGVDGDDHLPLREAVDRGHLLIEDSFDRLYLQIVVTRAKGPHLLKLALLGEEADRGRVGTSDPALLFDKQEIPLQPVPTFDDVARPLLQEMVDLFHVEAEFPLRAEAGGNGAVEVICKLLEEWGDLLLGDRCGEEAYPAVDVESDSPDDHDPLFDVERSHPTDWESVARVDIR